MTINKFQNGRHETGLLLKLYKVFKERIRLRFGLLDSATSLRLCCKSGGHCIDGFERFILAFASAFRRRPSDDLEEPSALQLSVAVWSYATFRK
jgi:hypothetical protein